uniref:Cell wall endopeptidase, family M23/M37 n=1 Tax=Klebsiella pneumoniae TaxID=573 RepID=A0A857AXM3_KLEPN|nr:Cell wall endopeptidase, family M23/M37 [Klebsiella pneumoniae]
MYSTDVVKENAYLSATRSGLESNEIATLQRSLPSRFNLRHLKKNESLKLVLQKKAGKSRVVAYKFTSGSFNYTAYRISDKSSITFPILPGKAVSIIRYRPQQDSVRLSILQDLTRYREK